MPALGLGVLAFPVQAGLREQVEGEDFSKVNYFNSVKDGTWQKSMYEGKEFSTEATSKEFSTRDLNGDRKGEMKKILPMQKNDTFSKVFDTNKRASGFEKPFADSKQKFGGFDARSAFDGKKVDWSKEEAKLGGENQEIKWAKENEQRYAADKTFRDAKKMYEGAEVKKVRQDVDIISEAAKQGVDLKDGRISMDQIREILNKK